MCYRSPIILSYHCVRLRVWYASFVGPVPTTLSSVATRDNYGSLLVLLVVSICRAKFLLRMEKKKRKGPLSYPAFIKAPVFFHVQGDTVGRESWLAERSTALGP